MQAGMAVTCGDSRSTAEMRISGRTRYRSQFSYNTDKEAEWWRRTNSGDLFELSYINFNSKSRFVMYFFEFYANFSSVQTLL
jgi:hypothetical protein